MSQNKEELSKKFDELLEKSNAFCMQYSTNNSYETQWFDEQVFEFFWREIEAREESYHLAMQYEKGGWYKDEDYDRIHKENEAFKAKISHLESVILAADLAINIWKESALDNYRYDNDRVDRLMKALEKYNQLKSNLK